METATALEAKSKEAQLYDPEPHSILICSMHIIHLPDKASMMINEIPFGKKILILFIIDCCHLR